MQTLIYTYIYIYFDHNMYRYLHIHIHGIPIGYIDVAYVYTSVLHVTTFKSFDSQLFLGFRKTKRSMPFCPLESGTYFHLGGIGIMTYVKIIVCCTNVHVHIHKCTQPPPNRQKISAPQKLTWNPNFEMSFLFKRVIFSGSMLIFQGISSKTAFQKTHP